MMRVALATAAMALALVPLHPAAAATCNLTVLGQPVIDDEPCEIVARGGAVTVLQGASVLARVSRSVLLARVAPDAGHRARSYRLDGLTSLGAVVTSNGADDKACYFNRRATLCIDD